VNFCEPVSQKLSVACTVGVHGHPEVPDKPGAYWTSSIRTGGG
jgi:hypothetical protein